MKLSFLAVRKIHIDAVTKAFVLRPFRNQSNTSYCSTMAWKEGAGKENSKITEKHVLTFQVLTKYGPTNF